MRLTMVLDDKELDSVPVEPHRCKQVGYLEAMQRCLKLKHREVLHRTITQPLFYLEVSSKMNDNAG